MEQYTNYVILVIGHWSLPRSADSTANKNEIILIYVLSYVEHPKHYAVNRRD